MSTVYDGGPVPPPTNEEFNAFSHIFCEFENRMHARFGYPRTMALLDWWCISRMAEALSNGFEHERRACVLRDLNEELRCEHEQDGWEGPPWVLIPTREP